MERISFTAVSLQRRDLAHIQSNQYLAMLIGTLNFISFRNQRPTISIRLVVSFPQTTPKQPGIYRY
jgi:hypothetical protein